MCETKGTCVPSLTMTGTQPAAIESKTRRDVDVSPRKCYGRSVRWAGSTAQRQRLGNRLRKIKPGYGGKPRGACRGGLGSRGQEASVAASRSGEGIAHQAVLALQQLLGVLPGTEATLIFLCLDPRGVILLLGRNLQVTVIGDGGALRSPRGDPAADSL